MSTWSTLSHVLIHRESCFFTHSHSVASNLSTAISSMLKKVHNQKSPDRVEVGSKLTISLDLAVDSDIVVVAGVGGGGGVVVEDAVVVVGVDKAVVVVVVVVVGGVDVVVTVAVVVLDALADSVDDDEALEDID